MSCRATEPENLLTPFVAIELAGYLARACALRRQAHKQDPDRTDLAGISITRNSAFRRSFFCARDIFSQNEAGMT